MVVVFFCRRLIWPRPQQPRLFKLHNSGTNLNKFSVVWLMRRFHRKWQLIITNLDISWYANLALCIWFCPTGSWCLQGSLCIPLSCFWNTSPADTCGASEVLAHGVWIKRFSKLQPHKSRNFKAAEKSNRRKPTNDSSGRALVSVYSRLHGRTFVSDCGFSP